MKHSVQNAVPISTTTRAVGDEHMTDFIGINELKTIYKNYRGIFAGLNNPSDLAFAKAVEEINGRVDNFIDALLEDILQELYEGAN